MIETRINKPDRMHGDAKQPREYRVSGEIRTETISGQQAAAIWESIATAFKVHFIFANQFRHFAALSLEPARGIDRFGLPLRMAESAQQQALAVNEARVGDKDHIRQSLHRLDKFDPG